MTTYQLGQDSGILRPQSLDETRQLDRLLTCEVRHELLLLSADLDPERFNDTDWLEDLSRALRERQVLLHVLLAADSASVHTRHGLLDLARRLPSCIKVRKRARADLATDESWLIADRLGIIRRLDGQIYADMRSISTAPQCGEIFMQLFEHAQDLPELRTLPL